VSASPIEQAPAALPWRKRAIFTLLPFLVSLFVLEVVSRLAGYTGRAPTSITEMSRYFWIADERLGFRNRPNGSFENLAIRGSPRITTDQNGNRNGFVCPAVSPRITVLFAGDSFTFCAEVNDMETTASETAKILCSRGVHTQVVNAGVRGFNTLQVRRRIEQELDRLPNTRVVLYSFCSNDPDENVEPGIYAPLLAPTVSMESGSRTFREMDVPAQVVPWGVSFDKSPLAPSNRFRRWASALMIHSHSALLNVVAHGISNLRKPPRSRNEGSSIPDAGREAVLLQILTDMRTDCERRNVSLVLTSTTRLNDVEYQRWLAGIARTAKVRFVSTSQQFSAMSQSYKARLSDSPGYDTHYNSAGTRAFAQALAPAIEEALR